MIGLPLVYVVAGAMFAAFAVLSAGDRTNAKRWGNAAFWGLVAVSFPAFSDGRGFSHASLLRTRLNYQGELRAVGDVLIDQVPLMLRCGIDSFAVTNATALQRLEEGRLPGIDVHYQPTARPAEPGEGYSWRRRSVPA